MEEVYTVGVPFSTPVAAVSDAVEALSVATTPSASVEVMSEECAATYAVTAEESVDEAAALSEAAVWRSASVAIGLCCL